MQTATFPCGHSVTFQRVKPGPKCPTCRTTKNVAFGERVKERVHRDLELMHRRDAAQLSHEYGRPHNFDICPLCQASREADEYESDKPAIPRGFS